MKQAVRIGLCGLFSLVALAQTQPSVAEILQKVSQTYKAVSEYEFVADLTARDAAGSTSAGHMLFAFRSPNRYRMEGAVPDMEGAARALAKSSWSLTVNIVDVRARIERVLHCPRQRTDRQRSRRSGGRESSSHGPVHDVAIPWRHRLRRRGQVSSDEAIEFGAPRWIVTL